MRRAGPRLPPRCVAIEFVDAALAQACLQELQTTRYACEKIVEVVRKPAGELADRFHLLALPQRLFGRHQIARSFLDAALEFVGEITERILRLLLGEDIRI